MSYDFDADWAAEIAEVSEDPAFQTCTVTLRNGTTKLAENLPARIIGVRATLDVSGQVTGSNTGSKSIRVQIPFAAYPARVARGTQVQVVDGGRNPALTGYLLVVDSDTFGGSRASHTLDCSVNVESVAVWT